MNCEVNNCERMEREADAKASKLILVMSIAMIAIVSSILFL